ncbi:MAG: hypothetical protein WDN06_07125 [Asticcacaulis sp.]
MAAKRETTYVIHLTGLMTAESPLTTTTPPLKNRPYDSDAPAPLPKMTVTYGDQRFTVPYMPGSGIRGKLRRCGVEVLRRVFPDGLKLHDYYYLAIGGVKGSGSENKSDFAAALARRKQNPLIGLFGAGVPWTQGRLSVSHAVPQQPISEQYITGVRTDDIGKPDGGIAILTPEEQALWTEMAYNNSRRSKKEHAVRRLKDDLKAKGLSDADRIVLQAQIAATEKEIAEHTAKAYSTNSVLRPLPGYEYIPQGTRLSHTMALTHVNAHEIGAFLALMREFAFHPVIGAKAAHNSGVVSATWSFSIRESLSHDLVSQGTLALRPYDNLDYDDKFLIDCAKGFITALDSGAFDFSAPAARKAGAGDSDDE